jgi:hypothetical protein
MLGTECKLSIRFRLKCPKVKVQILPPPLPIIVGDDFLVA